MPTEIEDKLYIAELAIVKARDYVMLPVFMGEKRIVSQARLDEMWKDVCQLFDMILRRDEHNREFNPEYNRTLDDLRDEILKRREYPDA